MNLKQFLNDLKHLDRDPDQHSRSRRQNERGTTGIQFHDANQTAKIHVKSQAASVNLISFEKENPNPAVKRTVLNDWAWAYPTFEFNIDKSKSSIKKITIDPSGLMADLKKENNTYELK